MSMCNEPWKCTNMPKNATKLTNGKIYPITLEKGMFRTIKDNGLEIWMTEKVFKKWFVKAEEK